MLEKEKNLKKVMTFLKKSSVVEIIKKEEKILIIQNTRTLEILLM